MELWDVGINSWAPRITVNLIKGIHKGVLIAAVYKPWWVGCYVGVQICDLVRYHDNNLVRSGERFRYIFLLVRPR